VLEYPLAAQDVSAISSWLGEAVAVVEARHAPEHAMGASIAVLGRRRKLRVETAGLVRRSA
jgi:hypothetical protein